MSTKTTNAASAASATSRALTRRRRLPGARLRPGNPALPVLLSLVGLALLSSLACTAPEGAPEPVGATAAGDLEPARPLPLEALESPAGPDSLAPFLSSAGDRVVMSWLEPAGDAHALRFSILEQAGWSTPSTVVEATDLFVNWADVPSVVTDADGALVAHWLADLGDSPYAYGIRIARSGDRGRSWSDPVWLHSDTSPTEHGFVSLVPRPAGETIAVWLDGRRFAEGTDDDGDVRPPSNEMTLRSTVVSADGTPGEESLIDGRVCDCCPTSAVSTSEGVVVVYRNRDQGEIRDIYVSRRLDRGWSTPRPVAEDGWKIPGCPVNGPAVDARGARLAVAWFTMGGGEPRGRVAFSEDAGGSFDPPIRIDGGTPLGRVDLVLLEDGDAAVLWLEEREGTAQLRLRRVGPAGGPAAPVTVATTGSSRSSGIPRMVRSGSDLVFAWRDTGEPSVVKTGRLPVDELPRAPGGTIPGEGTR